MRAQAGIKQLQQALLVLNEHLSKQVYLAGERLSLADIVVAVDLIPVFEKVREDSHSPSFPASQVISLCFTFQALATRLDVPRQCSCLALRPFKAESRDWWNVRHCPLHTVLLALQSAITCFSLSLLWENPVTAAQICPGCTEWVPAAKAVLSPASLVRHAVAYVPASRTCRNCCRDLYDGCSLLTIFTLSLEVWSLYCCLKMDFIKCSQEPVHCRFLILRSARNLRIWSGGLSQFSTSPNANLLLAV